jgi:NTE family protein
MASFVVDHPRRLASRLERRIRRQVTRRLLREAAKVGGAGATLTVLTPGPEDLAVMGANMMDPAKRLAVLETSLVTSTEALRHPRPDDLGSAL